MSTTIDKKKINRMKLEIIGVEKNNLKTKKKTKDEMIKRVRKIIVEEIKKAY